VRLRTVRNQNTQSVILPSLVAERTSSEFPHRTKRHITAVQVLIKCTTDTPDLSARQILETALKHSAKICDRAKREDMESHIKAGLALTGVRVLNTLEPTDKIKATDPLLRRTLIARVAPATLRLRLASSIDKASEKHNQRINPGSSTALSSALTKHFDTVRTTYVH
jgi:hypothetical protein